MHLSTTAQISSLVDSLVQRQRVDGLRQIIGIVGAPGTGKTTFAHHVASLLPVGESVVVPMDGFHLSNAILEGTRLRDRKGAIDTFDSFGYVALLERLRRADEPIVYAPDYRRGLEEPIAASVAVPQTTAFVLTEGNYLLADDDPWRRVTDIVHQTWFVEIPEELRVERLIARHMTFGMSRDAAEKWTLGPDQTNARYVEATKSRADLIVEWS